MKAQAKSADESAAAPKLHISHYHTVKTNSQEGEATVETITPETALAWLEHNTMNRPLNRKNVDSIKDDLLKGHWSITGETIVFTKDGTLFDGQNRLTAIAESGVTVRSWVIRGIDKKAFSKTGNGTPRSGGDTLAIAHFADPKRTSAIIKFVLAMNAGKHGDALKGLKRISKNSEVLAFGTKYRQKLAKICEDKSLYEHPHIMTAGVAGGFYFLFDEVSHRHANVFMHRLMDGTNLKKGSPIKVLRDKFENDATARLKMTRYDKLALVIKAWNLFRKDEKNVTQIRFNKKKEEFPAIQ